MAKKMSSPVRAELDFVLPIRWFAPTLILDSV